MTEINLLPEITRAERLTQRKIRRIQLFSAGILAVFLGLLVGVFAYWALLTNELSTLNRTFSEHESQLETFLEREGLVRGVVHKLAGVKSLNPSLKKPSPLLDSLTLLTLGKIGVSEVSIENDRLIRFGGQADSDQEMANFLAETEKLSTFGESQIKEITLESLMRDPLAGYRYRITIRLQSKPGQP